MCKEWNDERIRLEQKVLNAFDELFDHMGSDSCKIKTNKGREITTGKFCNKNIISKDIKGVEDLCTN